MMLGAGMKEAVSDGLFLTANDVRTTAVKSIQEVSPGKTVMRSMQGGGVKPHIAADEGYAPNTDSGTLVSRIHVFKNNDLDFDIEAGINYALYLEMGTVNMRPRPFMQPALDANKNKLVTNIKKVMDVKIKALSK